MTSQPIRVGFIGLSAQGSWAAGAHLPFLKHSPQYKIVALLNSSEEAAKAAIEAHGLDKDTKAYGSADAFAEDKDIDLIVCSVRVDKHYPVLKPVLEKTAATAVHCEWPLGRNLQEAQELADIAEKKNLKTIIGLQGRAVQTCQVVKRLVDEGRVGKMLSVTVTTSGYNFGPTDFEALRLMNDINIGGNLVTIHFSHTMDTISTAIGQLASYSLILETKRAKTKLRNKPLTYKATSPDDEPVKIVDEVERTSHDQIMLQGHLENGALFSFHMRGGLPFPGTKGLDWRIYGETGEIRITTPGMNLHYGGPDHTIQVHDFETDEVEDIEIPRSDFEKDAPNSSHGPGRVYDAFAKGNKDLYGDWQDAVKRHRLYDEMYTRAKEGGGEKAAKYTRS